MLRYYSCPNFSSFAPSTRYPSSLQQCPPLSSCPCVVQISSVASPFPILFLPCPCLFCTYHLCFLFPVPFPPFSLFLIPAGNSPCDLHFYESVPVLVVCLVFVFVLGSVVDSGEFVVILLLIVFDLLFLVLGVVVNNYEFAVIFTVHIFYLLLLR